MTESSFTYPHAGHTIKGRAADPNLHGRAMGKHAKQFGFKKPDYRLLVEQNTSPTLPEKAIQQPGDGEWINCQKLGCQLASPCSFSLLLK